MALELRKLGIKEVRPLVGGWHGWKKAGYPMELPEEFAQKNVVGIS